MRIYYLVSIFCMISMPNFASELYKWVDNKGRTHYSDTPPNNASTAIETLTPAPLNRFENTYKPKDTSSLLEQQVSETAVAKKQNLSTKESVVLSNNLFTQCFGNSPRATGESLNKEPLKEKEYILLKALFNELKGDWQGEATFIECLGTIEAPINKELVYKTELDITLRKSKELTLSFSMYSPELRKTKNEIMKLFLSDQYLSLSSRSTDKTVTLSLGENFFYIWADQFPMNNNHREIVRSFQLDNKTLKINQFLYSNQVLASIVKWELYQR